MAPSSIFSRLRERTATTLSPKATSTDASRASSPKPPSSTSSTINGLSTPNLIITSDDEDGEPSQMTPLALAPTDSTISDRRRPPAISLTSDSFSGPGPLDLMTPTIAHPNGTPEVDPVPRVVPPASYVQHVESDPARSRTGSIASLLRSKTSQQSLTAGENNASRSRRGSEASSAGSAHGMSEGDSAGRLRSASTTYSINQNQPTNSTSLLVPSTDTDAASIRSGVSSSGRKKKRTGWGRSNNNPGAGGIAGALAASGMSLAGHVSPPSPPLTSPKRINTVTPINSRVTRNGHVPRTSIDNVLLPRRQGSTSSHPRSSEDLLPMSEDSPDDVYDSPDALSFEDDDIPVTGFAVASSKRNADFHELFPEVPEGDYLIEDYGCAMQRDILVQGRLYISENHMCFHANIFGWVTNLTVPFAEVTSLEKKMTAFVIPNAIMVSTRKTKYTFASFITRDTSFEVMNNIWRLCQPSRNASQLTSRSEGEMDDDDSGSIAPGAINNLADAAASVGTKKRKKTTCACSKTGDHFDEVMMECVVPGTPEQIHNLIWTSGFIKDFMVNNQKLLDIQVSDWAPASPGSRLLTRNMTYIKPLNNSLGPRSTKCEITDEMIHFDLEDYVSTLTTTRTPGVPSGNAFSVKTRTCVMWAGPATTRVLVTASVVWTGRSFIKAMIEKGAQDGQRAWHTDLEAAMRAYIAEHKSEFFPDGMDESEADAELAAEALEAKTPTHKDPALSAEDIKKARQRETEQRGLQWAFDTAMGAWNVASDSACGAIEILGDLMENSSRPTLLGIVIFALVVSNVWTLLSLSDAKKRNDMTRRRIAKAQGVPVDSVAPDASAEVLRALLENVMRSGPVVPPPPSLPLSPPGPPADDELRSITAAIAGLEERVARLKAQLPPRSIDDTD